MAKTSSKKRKKKRSRKFPHNIPHWALWVGGIFIVSVYVFVFYYFFVSPYSFRWKGIFGNKGYPAGYSIHGIDISHHQGEIDWDLLRNAQLFDTPIRFVFMKATEGVDFLDENFNDNFYQARENNFIRGVYHFFHPKESPEAQARYFLKQVHLEDGDLPPVLDFEKRGTLTPDQIKHAAIAWLRVVENHYGVKPIIYTNYDFKLKYFSDSIFNQYPYWIAHYYVDTLQYTGPWKFWQHTDRGRVRGIKGFVDLDIYNGSMYDLQRFTIGRHEEEEELYLESD